MSIAGIASTLFSQLNSIQNTKQTTLQNEFQQLAKDLQAGNLTGAQADFAALQQNAPTSQTTGNTLSQAVTALGNDLKSGNLAGAQQDFATIQQDIQQAATQGGQVHHHHHHHASESQTSGASSSQQSIAQLFSTLGQDLQSGNITAAQQAYSSLQQDLPFFSAGGSTSATSAPVNVSA
jgi:outer membrane protein assembly factor BamD (BamD/ComL family)